MSNLCSVGVQLEEGTSRRLELGVGGRDDRAGEAGEGKRTGEVNLTRQGTDSRRRHKRRAHAQDPSSLAVCA